MKRRITKAIPSADAIKDPATREAINGIGAILRDLLGMGTDGTRVLFVDDLKEAGSVGVDASGKLFARTPRLRQALADQSANDAFADDAVMGSWVSGVFDATGGLATGSYELDLQLPANAIVTNCWIDVIEAFTGGALATVALSIPTDHAEGLQSASLLGVRWTAGRHSGIPNGTLAATFTNKTTAARTVTADVAVNSLTAGKARVFLLYSVSE